MSKPINQFGIKDAIKENKANININGIKDAEAIEMLQELIQDTYQDAKDYTDEQLANVDVPVFAISYGATDSLVAETLLKARQYVISNKGYSLIAFTNWASKNMGYIYKAIEAYMDTGKFYVKFMGIDTKSVVTQNGSSYYKVTFRTVSVSLGGTTASWTTPTYAYIPIDTTQKLPTPTTLTNVKTYNDNQSWHMGSIQALDFGDYIYFNATLQVYYYYGTSEVRFPFNLTGTLIGTYVQHYTLGADTSAARVEESSWPKELTVSGNSLELDKGNMLHVDTDWVRYDISGFLIKQ